MDGGWSVGIFPEGDQRVGEEMLPFQNGTGLLGVECRMPVIPIHIVSDGRVRSGPLGLLGREAVSVRIGTPLVFSPDTSYIEATRQLEEAVRSL